MTVTFVFMTTDNLVLKLGFGCNFEIIGNSYYFLNM